ncbi:MAG: nuclear transport factor 2 family protein [Planctomycetota bacterium]
MTCLLPRSVFVFPVWLTLGLMVARGQEPTGDAPADVQAAEETPDPILEVQNAVQDYAKAFNARDVDKLAAAWTVEGVYISPLTGERTDGREALRAQFKSLFAESDDVGTLTLVSETIDLVSPRVAVESGRALVVQGDDTITTSYKSVFVKEDGKWLLDRVSENEVPMATLRYEKLRGLEWMIGQWVDASEGYTFEVDCAWTSNQTYISRKFSVTDAEGVSSSGLQLIGWDPKEKQIRSWLFDSDGGFVSGVWTERDGVWKVRSTATLADGSSGSFVGVYRQTDDGNYTWQKVNQIIDGQLLPNLDEVTVLRK